MCRSWTSWSRSRILRWSQNPYLFAVRSSSTARVTGEDEHYNAIGTSRSTTAGNGAGQGGGGGPASGTTSQKRPASPNTGKQTALPSKKLAVDQHGALNPIRADGVLSLLQAINAGLQEASALQPTIDGYADQMSAIWRTVLVTVAGDGKTGGRLDVDDSSARTFRKLVDGRRTQEEGGNAGVFFSKCHSSAHTLFAFVRNAATSVGTKPRIEWQCAVCKSDTLHAVGRWDGTKVRAHLLSPRALGRLPRVDCVCTDQGRVCCVVCFCGDRA